MFAKALHAIPLLIVVCAVLPGADFYVDPAGSDANQGTQAAPWETIAAVNAYAADPGFQPGDTVHFLGGETFTGNISLDANSLGTAEAPITLTSYGSGRATIDAGDGDGINLSDTGGISITDLDLLGSGSGDGSAIDGYISYTDGRKLPAVRVARCEMSNFAGGGIDMGSWNDSYPGWDGLIFEEVYSHDNGGAGIFVWDMTETNGTGISHQNLRIVDCETSYNQSSGIIVCGVDGGVIEYCHAHHNSGDGGVGIWTYGARNILIQYCISNNQTATGADGSGFDLDGGSQNCVIQYCYSYDNDGCGFMHCDYPDSRPNLDNVIRYCVSENDCRKLTGDEGAFEILSWGDGITNCHIINCTVYLSPKTSRKAYGLWARVFSGANHHLDGCSFRNNVVHLQGTQGLWLARTDRRELEQCVFQGNVYHASQTGSRRWRSESTTHTTLTAWQDADGQEMYDGARVGLVADPQLVDPGTAGPLTDPRALVSMLGGYRLSEGSPCIDAGFDVATLFDIDTGTQDCFGNAIPQGAAFDIGVHEFPATDPGTLAFAASSASVTEAGGSVTITVSRSGGTDGAATVDYAVTGGTATTSSDFSGGSGTLTFAAGESSASFTVSIVDDTDDGDDEANETIVLGLSNATGASLGATTSSTLTIVDDDQLAGTLIANGGFETVQSGNWYGWGSGEWEDWGAGNTVTSDISQVRGGTRAVVQSGNNVGHGLTLDLAQFSAGTSYEFTAWVRSVGADDQFAGGLVLKDAGGTEVVNVSQAADVTVSGWTRYAVTFTVPADATRGYIWIWKTGSGGSLFIDDVSVTPIPGGAG